MMIIFLLPEKIAQIIMHDANAAQSISKTLNFDLILIIVFCAALAISAKKQLLTLKELIASGVVLTISSALLILAPVLKLATWAYSDEKKAILIAAGYTAIPVAALVIALFLIVRMYKSLPPPPESKDAKKKTRAKKSLSAAGIDEPKPKPARGHGKKRRF